MLQFASPIGGAALQKHVIRRIALDSEHSCRVHCYLENTCVSYNFGKRALGEDVCELNNATHTEHPSDLKTTPDFLYRGTEVKCYSFDTVRISVFIIVVIPVLIIIVFASLSQLLSSNIWSLTRSLACLPALEFLQFHALSEWWHMSVRIFTSRLSLPLQRWVHWAVV